MHHLAWLLERGTHRTDAEACQGSRGVTVGQDDPLNLWAQLGVAHIDGSATDPCNYPRHSGRRIAIQGLHQELPEFIAATLAHECLRDLDRLGCDDIEVTVVVRAWAAGGDVEGC